MTFLKEILIQELNNLEATRERPNVGVMGDLYHGNHRVTGIVFNSGDEYIELRRFTLRTLRDLGFGKRSCEDMILDECGAVVSKIRDMIEESDDGVLDLDKLFNKAALNVVWNITAGERFEYEEENMKKLYKFMDMFMMLANKVTGKPLGVFPFLKYFPPYRGIYNEVWNGMEECRQFVAAAIRKHEETIDEENPRDYIDKFLIASKENPHMNNEALLFCCLDLFIGGSETTSKSLMFALMMMIRNEDVQTRVREEIINVTGDNENVSVDDREKLHFTEAVLNEVWR